MNIRLIRRGALIVALLCGAAQLGQAQTAPQGLQQSSVSTLKSIIRQPAPQIDAKQLSMAIENARGLNRYLLQRVLSLGGHGRLAQPIGRSLAELAQKHRDAGDPLTASLIETSVTFYAAQTVINAYRSEETAIVEKIEAAGGTTVSAPSEVYGFASHGAPLRIMGPTH